MCGVMILDGNGMKLSRVMSVLDRGGSGDGSELWCCCLCMLLALFTILRLVKNQQHSVDCAVCN